MFRAGQRLSGGQFQLQQTVPAVPSLLDLQGSASNSYGSHSGGGYGSPGGSCFSIDICPDLILAAIAAAAAAGAFLLYMAITAAGRRKKRSEDSMEESLIDRIILSWAPQYIGLSNLLHLGLEEFEEKIDRIADGEDSSNDSWISKIYNQFSFFNDEDNSLVEEDMDGLEPPILDETWGLGVRSKDISANTTVSEAVSLEKESGKNKRSVEEDVIEEKYRRGKTYEGSRREMQSGHVAVSF